MKKLLIITLLLVSVKVLAQYDLAAVNYTKQDSIDVISLIKKAQLLPQNSNVFFEVGKMFIDRPYVGQTLDREKKERLVVNVREVDCTTYVEYVLAVTLCVKNKKTTFSDFCKYLADIRYIGGKVGYTTRQHYFSIWINDNIKDGFIEEIVFKQSPFTAIQTVNVDYMTKHVSSYFMLKNNRQWIKDIRNLENSINGKSYRYIPKSRIKNTKQLRNIIKEGDILAIVTTKKGLDISHLGLAVWKKDGLHLLNASSIHKKVISEPMTLSQYLQKHPSFVGIRVIRVK